MSNQMEHSEELFNTLSKNKKKRKRRIIRTVVIILLVLIIVLVSAVSILRRQVRERFASLDTEVLSHTVETGSISTVVSGSGSLTQVDLQELTVPAGVEITEVIVERNATVQQGDLLATVDMASVLTAMADLQSQMDDLDEEIADARGDEVSSSIRAGISGRVKRILAEPGMDVGACMAENGALAILSLDGYMALELQTDMLQEGDTVIIRRAEGKDLDGLVDEVINGITTILVTDNGPEFDEEVTVLTQDGEELGSGKLYIHSPLAITGFAGTIKQVVVKPNAKVSSSSVIFYLKNTSFSANYDTLLRERGELEQTLLALLTIYRDGAVLAPMDGVVSSIEFGAEESTTTAQAGYAMATEEEETEIPLLTLYPNISMSVTIGIDETDILSLEEGQEADVQISSVSDQVLTGVVTQIDQQADTSTGVTQYYAEITLDKVDGMLPGMTARVDVKIEGVENALIIPLDALHQTSAIAFVYTTYDQETQQYGGMTEITIGMQNDDYVEVLSGLSVGDTVWYTESQDNPFGFGGMGGMSGMPGGMGGMSGMSGMPSGGPPSNFGGSGGSRPRG